MKKINTKLIRYSYKCEDLIVVLFFGALLAGPIYLDTKERDKELQKNIIEQGNVLSKEVIVDEYETGIIKKKYSTSQINIYVDLNNDMIYNKEEDLLISSSDYIKGDINSNISTTNILKNINKNDKLIIERNPEYKNIGQYSIKAINNKKISDCLNENNNIRLKELLAKSK